MKRNWFYFSISVSTLCAQRTEQSLWPGDALLQVWEIALSFLNGRSKLIPRICDRTKTLIVVEDRGASSHRISLGIISYFVL